jgi:hypothetical protein
VAAYLNGSTDLRPVRAGLANGRRYREPVRTKTRSLLAKLLEARIFAQWIPKRIELESDKLRAGSSAITTKIALEESLFA